jgi:hypothetical protein
MSHFKTRDGTVVHFPPSPMRLDENGRILAPPIEELREIAAAVRPFDLPFFTRSLLNCARKRRRLPRYAAVNRARYELAKLIIDRMMQGGGNGAATAIIEGEGCGDGREIDACDARSAALVAEEAGHDVRP